MDVIYEPQGRAQEYAELACNPYNGCTHGCQYCYGARYGKDKYFANAAPKKNFIERFRKDVAKLDPETCPEILLSFQGDVYQPTEMIAGLTRQAIEILVERDLPFTVLTKGGKRAERDFDLLEQGRSRFGTSLVWDDNSDAIEWEPGASKIQSRFKAIQEAKKRDLPTWISLEPVIDTDQAFEVVRRFDRLIDFWTVGKINHHPELEAAVDWRRFREDIEELFYKFGAKYYIKKSLREWTP